MGVCFSSTVELQDFLDTVSIVLKYFYLYLFDPESYVCLACHSVLQTSRFGITPIDTFQKTTDPNYMQKRSSRMFSVWIPKRGTPTVEARKLEHQYPHAVKKRYKGSLH